MSELIDRTHWVLIYIGFFVDYFVFSKDVNTKICCCLFWIALVIFNIWMKLIKKDNE